MSSIFTSYNSGYTNSNEQREMLDDTLYRYSSSAYINTEPIDLQDKVSAQFYSNTDVDSEDITLKTLSVSTSNVNSKILSDLQSSPERFDEQLDGYDKKHAVILNSLDAYDRQRQKLKHKIEKLNTEASKQDETNLTQTELLMYMWIVIFIILCYVSFLVVIEQNPYGINSLSQLALFVFVLFMLYYLLKNLRLF